MSFSGKLFQGYSYLVWITVALLAQSVQATDFELPKVKKDHIVAISLEEAQRALKSTLPRSDEELVQTAMNAIAYSKGNLICSSQKCGAQSCVRASHVEYERVDEGSGMGFYFTQVRCTDQKLAASKGLWQIFRPLFVVKRD